MPELTDFQAAKATISSAELSGRIGPDTGATISYQESSGFELTWWFIPDPHGPPVEVRQLSGDELAALLGKLNELLQNPPATIDVEALKMFRDIVERYVTAAASTILAGVRFGEAVEEIFGGQITLTGHIGLGIDVAGTVHVAAGVVTWEHHVVPLPPGPFRPLTAGERDVLTEKLAAWLEDNQSAAWRAILTALEGQ